MKLIENIILKAEYRKLQAAHDHSNRMESIWRKEQNNPTLNAEDVERWERYQERIMAEISRQCDIEDQMRVIDIALGIKR